MLAAADGWLEPFRKLWEKRYGALDRVLEEMDTEQRRPQQRGGSAAVQRGRKARRKP
jgi:hypothetical protein